MTAWSFYLKLCCNTFCCAIDITIFSPTSFASTCTLIPALITVAMLRKRQLSQNGFQDSRNTNISHESVIYFPCLGVIKYLCCSLVLYCTPVSCCIALFTSGQTACAINHTRRWVSVMPRPLVKPLLVFRLRRCWANWTKPVCIGWRVLGAPNTVTSVDSTQTTSQEYMGIPLLCSTGTRKNYPRNRVLINDTQVEEQAQQWISHGVWSWARL